MFGVLAFVWLARSVFEYIWSWVCVWLKLEKVLEGIGGEGSGAGFEQLSSVRSVLKEALKIGVVSVL